LDSVVWNVLGKTDNGLTVLRYGMRTWRILASADFEQKNR